MYDVAVGLLILSRVARKQEDAPNADTSLPVHRHANQSLFDNVHFFFNFFI